MKVIFLDFDGVIVIQRDWRNANPECVKRLNRVTDATGAKIVVSSTWRLQSDYLASMKRWGITGEVIGATPTVADDGNGKILVSRPRSEEIQQWLVDAIRDGKVVEQFVVIDDEITAFAPHRQVGTNFIHGLTDSDVDRAVRLLK